MSDARRVPDTRRTSRCGPHPEEDLRRAMRDHEASVWIRQTRADPDGVGPEVCNHRGVGPTVLLIDDHADFRVAARAMLDAEGFDVVGEAADGEQAVAAVERLRPTVVLLDIGLPGIDGIEVAERLARAANPPTVVLISSRDPRAYGRRLAAAPARGFIAKAQLTGPALAALLG